MNFVPYTGKEVKDRLSKLQQALLSFASLRLCENISRKGAKKQEKSLLYFYYNPFYLFSVPGIRDMNKPILSLDHSRVRIFPRCIFKDQYIFPGRSIFLIWQRAGVFVFLPSCLLFFLSDCIPTPATRYPALLRRFRNLD